MGNENCFNFSNLKKLYIQTLRSFDKLMAFDIKVGKGRFLFMMSLSEEDNNSKDMLFIYMRNTNVLTRLKMYGNHIKGEFKVYIDSKLKEQFIQELQLTNIGNSFDFSRFLNQINGLIPLEISQEAKVNKLKTNQEILKELNMIDEQEKTVLVGYRHLSIGKPQEKTLRKLYLYINASIQDITELISLLKKSNMTVAWTTESNAHKAVDISEMISRLR